MQLKTCTKCGEEKAVELFPFRYGKASGQYQSWCKACSNVATRTAFLLRQDLEPKKTLLITARSRAKRKGLEFDLNIEDFEIPQFCPILGIELIRGIGRGGISDNSPSLDRIDSSKGYVKGNVWVISLRANRIKNDSTLEELKLLVAALTALCN